MIGKILCLLGFHPLWTNIYSGPDMYVCVRCRHKRYWPEENNP